MPRNPSKFQLSLFLLSILIVSSFFVRAADERTGIVVGTGKANSSYWHAGARLKKVAGEIGIAITAVESEGSLENLDNLFSENSPVNLVFAQADALQLHLNRYPSDRRKIEILEKIGQQCVFFVTALRADFDDVEDIEDGKNIHIGIDSASSTVSLSYEYMQNRASRFEDAEIVYDNFSELSQQLYQKEGKLDALMLLSAPREYADNLQYILDNPHRYRLLDFEGDELTEPLPDGRKIFRAMRLALPGASKPVRTLCARGLLIANRQKLSSRQRNRLTDLVSYYWMRIYATSSARR